MLLLSAYILLSAGALIALNCGHRAIAIALLLVIALSILLLGYMWIHSPM